MAPKRERVETNAHAPAVKRLAAALGGDVTPDSIQNANPALRNAAFGALRTKVGNDANLMNEFQALETRAEKQAWLADYILDPSMATRTYGVNKTTRKTRELDDSTVIWLTETQLAGPMYMNSVEDAKIAVTCMKERPHKDNEELRKKGVKQYEHRVDQKKHQMVLEKEASVATEANLTAAQYQQVAEHMGDARNPGHADPGQTSPPASPPPWKSRRPPTEGRHEGPHAPEGTHA